MYIMTICHWAILHYNMSFQTIAGRSNRVFWWFHALSEDQEKIICRIHQNYLVALIVLEFKIFLTLALLKVNIWSMLCMYFHRAAIKFEFIIVDLIFKKKLNIKNMYFGLVLKHKCGRTIQVNIMPAFRVEKKRAMHSNKSLQKGWFRSVVVWWDVWLFIILSQKKKTPHEHSIQWGVFISFSPIATFAHKHVKMNVHVNHFHTIPLS